MKRIYIDVGSSTIKVYEYVTTLRLLEEHSIYFKTDFSKEYGISVINRQALYDYFHDLKQKYHLNYVSTYIYATGIFREIPELQKQEFVREFNDLFDLHFSIISHSLESYYLSKAMEGYYNDKKVLILNMGGKTTELVTYYKGKVIGEQKLSIGVSDLLINFPKANASISEVSIEEVVDYIKQQLLGMEFDSDYDCAIFTGGEKRFENLTNYALEENTLFEDGIHDQMITFENFIKGNHHIFFELTMEDLYRLMPQNPKWMDGARLGAILPQTIFEKAHIPFIIPSDLNLIHGIIKDEGNNM